MGDNSRRFTEEEYDYIRYWHGRRSIKEIAEALDRSHKVIQNKVNQLGIAKLKHNPPWSDEEIQQLKKLLPTHTKKQISEKLNRSINAVGTKLQKLGLKAQIMPSRHGIKVKPWTKKEEDLLLFLAGRMPLKYASKRLGRSRKAIEIKCRAMGIIWKSGTITVKEICRVTELSESAVRYHVRKLRLKKGQSYWTDPDIISKIATSVLNNNKSLNQCRPSIKHLEAIERGDFEYASVAQSVERFTCNEDVGGSIPLTGSCMVAWDVEPV